ncbi:MAG: hypothetical protein HZA89_09005 [Verrucomicrobia bacterium]|nr:hypothetical protein [Verrucomicrobiota bacterium]
MKTWRVILATLVIYGAGVMTGALILKLDRQINPPPATPKIASPGTNTALPPMPIVGGNNQKIDFLQKLDRQLRFKPEQYEAVEKVLDDSHKRTRVIREKIAPQIQAETARLNGEIRAKLTPEQAKKFDEVMKPRLPRKGGDKIPKKQKMASPGAVPSAAISNNPAPSTPRPPTEPKN